MKALFFLGNYWYLIIAAIAIVAVISIKLYVWFKKPSNEQMRKIQEWLVWAVAQAEKKLGSQTGQLKLRYVYDMFISKFPGASIFIPFDTFKSMVDKALDELQEMIENNEKIQMLFSEEEEKEKEE